MKLKLNRSKLSASLDAKKRERFIIKHGDNLEVLRSLNPNQFDSLVTDPPAGISFMGKDWDSDKGGRDQWIRWLSEVLSECYRVMKPGAHGVVWALPKTSHWTAIAIEDAGFEIVDCVMHLFGQGFPKSQNISKMIDKEFGAEREVIGTKKAGMGSGKSFGMLQNEATEKAPSEVDITAPATPEAQKWDGWGTALKPRYEPWWLIRKPKSESSIARNVLKHGVGGINIDGARIATDDNLNGGAYSAGKKSDDEWGTMHNYTGKEFEQPEGRFPANVVFSHTENCRLVGTKTVGKGEKTIGGTPRKSSEHVLQGSKDRSNALMNYGTETVEAWECSEDCAVKILDEQVGCLTGAGNKKTGLADDGSKSMFGIGGRNGPTTLYDRGGSASRFFYVAKASKSDKGDENGHPTVKSTKLMEYLIKLVTPENGTVLDPFMGSGTTGVSAIRNDFKFFGIDQEQKFVGLAYDRMMNEYKVTEKKLGVKRVTNGKTNRD
jgi:site-specific DNA-methyltransferase (adenine-specific)